MTQKAEDKCLVQLQFQKIEDYIWKKMNFLKREMPILN